MFCEKLNHWYEKFKNEIEEKINRRGISSLLKTFKGRSTNRRKFGHKLTDPKCTGNEDKDDKDDTKN